MTTQKVTKPHLSEKAKTIITVILLLATIFLPLLGLIGVVLMWFWMKWPKWVKLLVTTPFVFVFIVMPLFVGSYLFLARPFQVKGDAMAPNYRDGQYLISSPVRKDSEVKRGEVIIMKSVDNPKVVYIKRVIGLPGESVMLKDGLIYINGEILDEEDYLKHGVVTSGNSFIGEGEEMKVPNGQYFVLGDNRMKSVDSRKYGFVPRENIVSKVQFCYWNCWK